ncbi:MAG: PAS domain S-box protein, partial [Deltaproteobacteria bacterium]|nr:PAS domain S-box protein [Deltaproteobacteria bacterium]
VNYLANKHQITNLKVGGDMGIEAGRPMPLHLAVPQKDAVLAGILAKGMALITDEEFQALSDKWLGSPGTAESPIDLTPAPQTAVPISYGRLIGYSIAVFLILCLLSWLLIKTIKKEQIAVHFGTRWFRGLVLAGLSVFVIIICLLSWFTLERIRGKMLVGVSEDLTDTLITADDRVNLWVEQRTSSLKLLVRDPDLVSLTGRLLAVPPNRDDLLASSALQDIRSFFKKNKVTFLDSGFFIINTNFVSIGSMRETNIGTRNIISFQRQNLLRRAFAGEFLFVPPIESDVPLVEGSKSDRGRNPSTKFFMGPIRNPYGEIIAVIAQRGNPSKDLSQLLLSSKKRKTGETYAFSEHGELLSESRFNDQLRGLGLIGEGQQSALNMAIRDPGVNLVEGQRPETERSQQLLTRMASRTLQLKRAMEKAGQTYGRSNIEIDTKGYRDYRGVPVFGAWLWNADLVLGLATEIDVAEAMSDYYQIRRTVFGMLAVTLLLSVGATMLVLLIGERTSQALRKSRDELELRVQERTAKLHASDEKSRLLLESVGEGIFGVDLDGKVAFMNPAANQMLGYGPEELIGKEIHEKIHHSHADGSAYPKSECPMYLTRADGTDHHIADEVLWQKDGSSFPVEYTSMPIKKNGQVVGAVVTFMDITERKRAEEKLKESEEALREQAIQLRTIFQKSPMGILHVG